MYVIKVYEGKTPKYLGSTRGAFSIDTNGVKPFASMDEARKAVYASGYCLGMYLHAEYGREIVEIVNVEVTN